MITKRVGKNEKAKLATTNIKSTPLYLTVLALWGAYLFTIFHTPDTSAKVFGISPGTLDLIRLSVAIPYLLIWLSAAYAYIKIKRYAVVIKPSSEALAFEYIAKGILILLGGLILSTLLSTTRSLLPESSRFRPLLTILTNYSYILPYLIAFSFLFYSTILLTRRLIDLNISFKKYIIHGVALIIFAYIWLDLIFTNPSRATSATLNISPTYYLKDSLLILTVVIPALISWSIGFLAIIKLRMYYHKVKGQIYRSGLSSLVYGFIGTILASIFLQALLSLGAKRLVDQGLEKILIAIYLFLFMQAVGFVLLARGANNLTQIETV